MRARQAEGADGEHFAGSARTSAATAQGVQTVFRWPWDHIEVESARRRTMYLMNCRHLHKVVDKIESEARDYLAIRDRVREVQIGLLQRSCRLPVVAMFSKEP
jgi:hypothetical protein